MENTAPASGRDRMKKSSALYRKEHWFAIKLKNQMYKRLPLVKKRVKGTRRQYHKEYYQKHRDEILKRAHKWSRANKDKTRLYKRRYKEKLRRRRKRRNMKSKIERIIKEFLEYCKDRYDKETLRHYTMNMKRFYNYIEQHKTRCKEYHDRYYYENKKPLEKKGILWKKAYRRIQYVEQLDRDFITRYVSYVNHEEISKNIGQLLSQSEKESRLYPLKTFLRYCERKGYLKNDLRRFIHIPPRGRYAKLS